MSLRHLPSCQETDTVSLLPPTFAHLTFYLFLIAGHSNAWLLAFSSSIFVVSFVKNGQMFQGGKQ